MQATNEGKGGKTPPAGGDRRRNAGPEKKRAIEPVEGAQTGSEGLGYLKKPRAGRKHDASRGGR